MTNVNTYSKEIEPLFDKPTQNICTAPLCNGSPEPFFIEKISLHDLLLDNTIDEITSNPSAWPAYKFTFSPTHMTGVGVIEATASTRITASLRGIKSMAPESIETAKNTDAIVVLRGISHFLKQPVSIDADTTKMPREDILPPDKLTQRLSQRLQKQADPIMQGYDQIIHSYKDQIETTDLDRLKHELILVAKPETIKNIYKTYISQLRTSGTTLLNLMMQ